MHNLKNLHSKISSFFGDERLIDNKKDILFPNNPISDYLPYRFYDPQNQIFINEESIGFVLEIGNLFGANRQDIEAISNLLRDNVEGGSVLQFLNYASPRIGNMLDKFLDSRVNDTPEIIDITKRRINHVLNGNFDCIWNANTNYRIRNFKTYLIFAVRVHNEEADVIDKLMNLQSSFNENSYCQKRIKDLVNTRQNFISLLDSIGLGSKIISADELLQLTDNIVNANIQEKYESQKIYNEYELLSKQIPDIDNQIIVSEDEINLHADKKDKNVQVRCYSVKQYPVSHSQSDNINLIGDYNNELGQIPCTFLQTVCVFFPYDAEKEKSKVKFASIKLQKNKENPFFRFFPEIIEKANEYNFVSQKLDEGQKIVDIWMQVMLIAKPKMIDTAERSLIALYGRSGFNLVADKYLLMQSFLSFLPFTLAGKMFNDLKICKRTDRVLSWTVANIAPLQGELKGNPNPCMLLFGRRGQPYFFNPFSSPQGGNFNTCIVGKSGSGKSFFMQDYIMSLVGTGGRVIVIDDGQSFQKTCLYLDGKYIEFTEGNNICLNPFTFLKALNSSDEDSFYNEVVNFISKLIRTIITREDELCSKEEASLIAEAVSQAIERKGQMADISVVSDVLLEWYNDKNINQPQHIIDMMYSISLRMRDFTTGAYNKYFIGEANLTIDNNFVVFELSHIKDKPELQRTITLFASFLGFKEMYLGDRNQKKAFVVDEAWALLAGKEMAEFMEGMARRARKYNGQLVIATQSIEDFYKSPATTAILQNSDYLCILAQKAESITTLEKSGKVGDMSKHFKDTLLSIRTEKGKYSEVFIFAHGTYTIARLIVDQFSAKLYSSDAREFKQIENFMKQGHSVKNAIKIVLNEHD